MLWAWGEIAMEGGSFEIVGHRQVGMWFALSAIELRSADCNCEYDLRCRPPNGHYSTI